MLTRAGWWLVEWAVLCLLWLLFVDSLRWTESVSGIGAAALAATAVESVRGEEHPHFLPYVRWIVLFWRLPGEILHDHWLLLRHLGRMVTGRPRRGFFEALPFAARGSDPRSVARRALTIEYTTLPPNAVVIGIDRVNNVLILHQLERAAVSKTVAVLESRR